MWLSHRCRPTKVHQPNFVFRTKHIQSTLPKQILAACISLVWAMGSPLMSTVLFCLNSASMYVDLKWLVEEFMPKVALYWWLSHWSTFVSKIQILPKKNSRAKFQHPSVLSQCLGIHVMCYQCFVLLFSSLIPFSAVLNLLECWTPWLLWSYFLVRNRWQIFVLQRKPSPSRGSFLGWKWKSPDPRAP